MRKPKNNKFRAEAFFKLNGDELTKRDFAKIKVLPKPPTETTYLSDIGWVSATAGWKRVQRDQSVGGHTLSINGQTFPKGLGTHAYSKIVYILDKNFSKFIAQVGVDDEMPAGSPSSIVFQVWGDGKKLYDSGLMTETDDAKSVMVDISNVNKLALVVTTGGNGNGSDHADWAAAKIIAK